MRVGGGVQEAIWAQGSLDNWGVEKTKYRGAGNLYSSPNIIWVIISKRMRWAELVACMGRG